MERSKSEFRKEMLMRRRRTPPPELISGSERIAERLISLPEWRNAPDVCLYVSFGEEVETRTLIREALLSGKRVFLPRVCGRELVFCSIRSMEDLAPGYRGIQEPVTDPAESTAGTPMILPGCAFDLAGNRMGYGGGYYDRFLARDKGRMRIALSYDFAVFDEIPRDEGDQRVDLIVTETRLIDCRGRGSDRPDGMPGTERSKEYDGS